ncbi:MAG: MarR family transcriptional regulator [Pseudomonadales bacterium]|nr:MarR family transcriptional regulator [Pseudomonadales bacterium]
MNKRTQQEYRVILLLGIIEQLKGTREEKLFSELEISPSQFGVLNHFTHNPDRRWTISELCNVMEMQQPGITKIVQRLTEKKLLTTTADKTDARKKQLQITDRGLKYCEYTVSLLIPDIHQVLEDWQDDELAEFSQHLEKLKCWLDDNRDTVILPEK